MARRKRKSVEPESEEWSGEEERIIASYKERINNPLTAIRSMCVECVGGSIKLVSECTSVKCSLHAFRMGKNTMHGSYGKENDGAKKKKKTK